MNDNQPPNQSSGYSLSALSAKVTRSDIRHYLQTNTSLQWWELYGREVIGALAVAFGVLGLMSIGALMIVDAAGLGIIAGGCLVVMVFCLAGLSQLTLEQSSQARLWRFVQENGLRYTHVADSTAHKGIIFSAGFMRRTRFVVQSGADSGQSFEIGRHSYVVSGGRGSQSAHYWWYLSIDLDRNLPHIVLDSKNNTFSLAGSGLGGLESTLRKDQRIDLEGNFGEYFTLYSPHGYDADVRYILTPDLMTLLIDHANMCDIEIVDNKAYFYIRTTHPSSSKLDEVQYFDLALKIITALGPKITRQTDYYADHRVRNRSLDAVAPEGRRLRSGIGMTVAMIIVAFVVHMVLRMLSNS